jgi:hypothetical protein
MAAEIVHFVSAVSPAAAVHGEASHPSNAAALSALLLEPRFEGVRRRFLVAVDHFHGVDVAEYVAASALFVAGARVTRDCAVRGGCRAMRRGDNLLGNAARKVVRELSQQVRFAMGGASVLSSSTTSSSSNSVPDAVDKLFHAASFEQLCLRDGDVGCVAHRQTGRHVDGV